MALDAKTRALYLKTWSEDFADVEADRLRAAFVACIRSHTFKTMPTIGDVRQHLQKAEGNAIEEEAAKKFEQVAAYAVRRSPDIPEKNPPKISEHTRRAINAAGGLDYLRDCDRDSLQWARKRFVEAYVRYAELQQDEYLLPPGEVRDLLAGFAETKALRAPGAVKESYQEMRARGLAYMQELKASPAEDPNIKRALREIRQRACASPHSLEKQKQILREKGFLPKEEYAEARS